MPATRPATTIAPVAVVGGGLAGITAALALAEAGCPVTLYEARPRLGGAAHSFQRGGLTVDNGQHVFLRCCTAYRGLLDRLGGTALVSLQNRFDVRVLGGAGRSGRLRRASLPGPLHFVPALAGYRLLGPGDRIQALRGSLALSRLDPADPVLDTMTFGSWLAAHGQGAPVRQALWDLLAVAALNTGVEEVALGPAVKVFKTALLGRPDAADLGIPLVPLGRLHDTAAQEAIARRGGVVRLSAKVTAIEPDAVIVDGVRTKASAVVVATRHEQAATLVPAGAAPGRDAWSALDASPIINVHALYDRPVMRMPFVAVTGSPVQWVFDKTRVAGLGKGQYLAVSVSVADTWIDRPTADIRAAFVPELRSVFPAAREARLTDFFVTRERRATFRQAPGSGALRPHGATRWPGLYLAGAWTDTGWPDTMEGAVRSGLHAARLVRHHVRHQESAS
ncbi:hydroxysqualene dehydroxylase HpnE [Nonomuraea antimicrobica]|uniref:Hydroxysqualene dehydroxylase HpnE n=1 Tax=Nonomuraea antimicrobica TaxID=561173 RepID=A0ABP7E0Z4_9ACTN